MSRTKSAVAASAVAIALTVAPDVSAQTDEPWASPTGPTGVGLGMPGAGQLGRAWFELGFFKREVPIGFAGDVDVWGLTPVFGAGFFVIDDLEVEAIVPMGIVSIDDENEFVTGNVFLGVNYHGGSDGLRYRVGGGFGLPLADADQLGEVFALAVSAAMHAGENLWLWAPDAFPLVVPRLRVEYDGGTSAFAALDFTTYLLIPIGDRDDPEFGFEIAPNLGLWVGDTNVLGLRFPIQLALTNGDKAIVGMEPFLRFGDPFFATFRATLILDDPNSFTDDGIWAVHAGFGGAF